MNLSNAFAVWSMIGVIVLLATAGDVLLAGAIRQIGDFDVIRSHSGLKGAVLAVLRNARFFSGVLCMALSFSRCCLRSVGQMSAWSRPLPPP